MIALAVLFGVNVEFKSSCGLSANVAEVVTCIIVDVLAVLRIFSAAINTLERLKAA